MGLAAVLYKVITDHLQNIRRVYRDGAREWRFPAIAAESPVLTTCSY